MYLYKKWNFIILLNNLILNSRLPILKKVFFLQFDIYKYYFYNFSKKTSFSNTRIVALKNKLIQKL